MSATRVVEGTVRLDWTVLMASSYIQQHIAESAAVPAGRIEVLN